MNKVKELAKSSLEITYELFIIMIPTLIVVKILDELGFVEILNNFCAPLMFLLGLPEAISLVFTTSIYALIAFGSGIKQVYLLRNIEVVLVVIALTFGGSILGSV